MVLQAAPGNDGLPPPGPPTSAHLRCLMEECVHRKRIAAGGLATPADVAMLMSLGVDGVFVGSGIFKGENPAARARAMVAACTHFKAPGTVAAVSENLGKAMVGLLEHEDPVLVAQQRAAVALAQKDDAPKELGGKRRKADDPRTRSARRRRTPSAASTRPSRLDSGTDDDHPA